MLHCHIEANHPVSSILSSPMYFTHSILIKTRYNDWCDKNNFESKLLKAVKAQKSMKEAEDHLKQTLLDLHLKECPPKETYIPYSDGLFQEVTIEWLIATDQVSFLNLFSTCTIKLSCSQSKLSNTHSSRR